MFQNLFAFGDKDGTLHEAKLQHVLGIAMAKNEDTLFVADTYNHKLKKIDVTKNTVSTICGSTAGDVVDGKTALFNEPSGISFSNIQNQLYLSDTNNHCVKVITLSEDIKIEKLNIHFDENVYDSPTSKSALPIYEIHNTIEVNQSGGKINFKIELDLIEETTLTTDAPQKWNVRLPNSLWTCVPNSGKNIESMEGVINMIPCDKKCFVDFTLGFYTCNLDTCTPRNFVVRQPIIFSARGLNENVTKIIIYVGASLIKLK